MRALRYSINLTGGPFFDDIAIVWDAKSHRSRRKFSANNVPWNSCLAISPDGKTLAVGSEVGTVRLWDVDRGKETDVLSHKGNSVDCVASSPDGILLAAGGGIFPGKVVLWDVAHRHLQHLNRGTRGPITEKATEGHRSTRNNDRVRVIEDIRVTRCESVAENRTLRFAQIHDSDRHFSFGIAPVMQLSRDGGRTFLDPHR